MTNEELQKEMIAAMKAKDKVRLSIIRQVKAEVKNIEVNERRDVTEEDVNSMIKRLIKQTSETLEMSIKAGTDQERTDNLTEQVKILESLLPAQVSGEELEALIEQVIAELGATSKKQMGQVMGALGKATGGNFDKPAAADDFSVDFDMAMDNKLFCRKDRRSKIGVSAGRHIADAEGRDHRGRALFC